MSRLRASDLHALLSFVGEAHSRGGPDALDVGLLERLTELVPCDLVTFNELDRGRRVVVSYRSSSPDDVVEELPADAWDALDSHPVIVHRLRSGDTHSVLTLSDLFDRGARLRHEAHPDYSREFGIIDEAWLYLGPSLTQMVAVGFQSCRRDLSMRDRAVLELLRPHLIALDRAARVRRRLSEVLDALAQGDAEGIDGLILLGPDQEVEHATQAARHLVSRWFCEFNGRLPAALRDWLASPARASLSIERGGRRLVVDAPNESAMLLREEAVPMFTLTRREWEVLRCIAVGKSTTETARLLWVTPATVSKHLEHIYEKLGVHSRTAALAALAMTTESPRRTAVLGTSGGGGI